MFESEMLMEMNSTILSENDVYDDNNIYYRLVGYYLNRNEYVKSSQVLYTYVIALYKLFFCTTSCFDKNSMLAVWSECTKVALLAVSCMNLVKPNMQWFVPEYGFVGNNSETMRNVISITHLELEYFKCKAVLDILVSSLGNSTSSVMIIDKNEYFDTDLLLNILNSHKVSETLINNIRQRMKMEIIHGSILY